MTSLHVQSSLLGVVGHHLLQPYISLSISGHCVVLCQSGLKYPCCTFLLLRVMLLLQFAPLSALDLVALAHNTQKTTTDSSRKHMWIVPQKKN